MNYIKAHRALSFLMKHDENIKPSEKSFMDTLFCVWNEKNWADQFRVSRDDMMESCKISNRKTYYKVISNLVELGYITYEPSKNPEVASKFGMGKKVTSYITSYGSSTGSSTITSHGSSYGSSSVTIYKQLNNKTIKLLNDYTELVNDNLEKWITETTAKDTKPSKEDFNSWISEIGRTEKFGEALWDYMNERDWRTAKDEPIKNWKTYCSSVIRSDDWQWGKVEDEAREQLYKDAMWLSQSRGRSYLIEETARSQLGMGRLDTDMEKRTERYLKNKKIVGLDDNSIHEFLRNKGRQVL